MSIKVLFKIAFLMLVGASLAAAHPLGNFTVNQYSRLEIEKNNVKLRAVLDLAEIPTFQESSAIDANRDGTLSPEELNDYAEKITPAYISNLFLTINNSPIHLHSVTKKISLPTGAGNLPTLRIEWDLVGELSGVEIGKTSRAHFENRNNPNRIGWNEIVVTSADAVKIFNSAAYGSGITDELKVYPQESLSAPLAERAVDFSFASGALPANAKILQDRDGRAAAPVQKDKFAELINVPEITLPIVLFGLILAFGFGAIHAMSPGHGKTVVGAYLVGSRGTIKHAIFLGLTVTITHTLGVFALGIVTLFASEYIFPERLIPFLNFVSGLLVLFIGLTLFKTRLFTALGWNKNAHQHEHSFEHSHGEEDFQSNDNSENQADEHAHDGITHTHSGSTHSHLPPQDISWSSLLGLGISGGLLPCPSALVLMLSAISLNRIGYGLVLTLVFSFGLAATLTGFGLAFLYVGKLFDGTKLSENRIFKTLPVFSAFVVACLGAIICYGSLK